MESNQIPLHNPEDQAISNSTNEETVGFSMGVVKNELGENLDSAELSQQELIKKAEEFQETLELEKAVALYDEGLTRFPNDTTIMDNYTDLLLSLNESQKA